MKNGLRLVFVSTPIGYLGSGKGGGVELTLVSLIKGLISLGHEITLVAPKGSNLPFESNSIDIRLVDGSDQPSWQHQDKLDPILIPSNGVLPKLWEETIKLGKDADAVINFGYDWLPLWLTKILEIKLYHLISMGAESIAMKNIICEVGQLFPSRLAFHSKSQSSDFLFDSEPIIVGNGFDMNNYFFNKNEGGPLGWAGRISPEKGLEDAVKISINLGEKLLVWGHFEDNDYALRIEESFPKGTIEWKGFLQTREFQEQLGLCRAFINTPKWNEAYGNVLVEAMACGVPVIAYNLGGPGDLVKHGYNGFLVEPNDINGMIKAVKSISKINRNDCRIWAEKNASHQVFAKKVEDWITSGIKKNSSQHL